MTANKTYNPMSKEFQDECEKLGLTGRQLIAKYKKEGKSIKKDEVYIHGNVRRINHTDTKCCVCGSSESYIKYIDSNTKKPVYLWYREYNKNYDGDFTGRYLCNKCWNKESPNSFDNIQKSLRNKRIEEYKRIDVYDKKLRDRLLREYDRNCKFGYWQNWKRNDKINIEQLEKIFGDKINNESIWDFYNFWNRVDIKDNNKECWNYKEGTTIDGYGCFIYHGDNIKAHRMAYILSKGNISKGFLVMHLCNNPVCCNPNHLELGNDLKNSQYKYKCNRQNMTLTVDQIRDIHKMHKECPELTQWQIAEKFKITQGMISMIIKGKSWHNIYGEFYE
jgi:hypothetical protein